jgi:hypothetical protein
MAKLPNVTAAFLRKVYSQPPFLDIHYFVRYKSARHRLSLP